MDELESWRRSADAWVQSVDEGDPNREWLLDPVMLEYCGPVGGIRGLDVGCGEGRFCRMLARRGAAMVGIDPVEPLIEIARDRRGAAYLVGRAEELPFGTETFDLVVSYVQLLDVVGYREAIAEMARVLRPGGRLVLSNLNSFVTTTPTGWIRNGRGEKLYFPIDRYFEERAQHVAWKGIEVINYHRPMSAYLGALLGAGMVLRKFSEPRPTMEAVEHEPRLLDGLRVPMFFVSEWHKP